MRRFAVNLPTARLCFFANDALGDLWAVMDARREVVGAEVRGATGATRDGVRLGVTGDLGADRLACVCLGAGSGVGDGGNGDAAVVVGIVSCEVAAAATASKPLTAPIEAAHRTATASSTFFELLRCSKRLPSSPRITCRRRRIA